MVSLGLHLLTIVLGVIFVFLGHVKLTPQFFPEYHSQIRNEFGKLNKEFPFFHITGWRPYAKSYRLGVGIAEMSSGTLLLLGGAFSQLMSNVVLLVIITNFLIAFQKLNYGIEYIVAVIFLALLLVLRLILASRSKKTRNPTGAKQKVENKVE
ncbi:unnamed protein product [Rotaria magnacalcarata]|uniref:Transmembrane protein 35B n=1 Tax=Rotaria magnacalcarata TaxID=392030 RepID=A0A816LM18_9BILA|nr:unnamed protein product [Rotaria magnacalcarata]CAF1601684.1 unnamed protein product [Rotaria magnacalcarata]CAF1937416.1 unnamed protein product [Rotaria magnacalcarata]CAF2055234.1 unnamed protein product [Rotaria magnacalcarata]CAF2066230.1 unnamed protein product [Rotaria magnacalcarata]